MVKKLPFSIHGRLPSTSRVGDKLTISVFLLSLLIVFLSAAYHLFLEYKREQRNIDETLSFIEQGTVPSLCYDVWTLDSDRMLLQLDGLVQRSAIVYAAITSDQDKLLSESGVPPKKQHITKKYSLTHQSYNKNINLGTLTVVADTDRVYSRLVRHVSAVFITQGIHTFAVAFIILYLFRQLVSKRLGNINTHLKELKPKTTVEPLAFGPSPLGKKDELDNIADSINKLHERISRSFRSIADREEKLRLFFDASEDGIFSVDRKRKITFVNKAFVHYMGLSSVQEPLGCMDDQLFRYSCKKNADGSSVSDLIEFVLETGVMIERSSCLLQLPNQQTIPVSIRVYPIFTEENLPSGAVIFFTNIGAQLALEHELLLLGEAVDHSPVVVVVCDKKSCISYVNPGFERLTGFTRDEVIGRKPAMIDRSRDEMMKYRDIQDVLISGDTWRGHLLAKTKSGISLTMETVISPVCNTHNELENLVVVSQDVSGEIELRNQLYQAQKMEAIGRLAASIAHEFGNPLFGIKCLLNDYRNRVTIDDEDRKLLDIAVSECDRMKDMIKSLRDLHHPTIHTAGQADVNDVIERIITLHESYFDIKKIVLESYLAPHLPSVEIPENRLIQVVVNLLLNARDAMSSGEASGGTIRIETKQQGDKVEIQITDSGSGMPEEIQEQVFEPFFSTKPQVEGAGLGLPVSYGIIAGFGGEIKLRSEQGIGSTFTISLPICKQKEEEFLE